MENGINKNTSVVEPVRESMGAVGTRESVDSMGLSRYFAAFSQSILDRYAIWENYPWSDAVIRYLENEKQEEASQKKEPSSFFVTMQLLKVYLMSEREKGKADGETEEADHKELTLRIEAELRKLKSEYDRYFGILERLYREGAQMPGEEFSRIWAVCEREARARGTQQKPSEAGERFTQQKLLEAGEQFTQQKLSEAGEQFTQQKLSEAGEQFTQQKLSEAGERFIQQKPPEAGERFIQQKPSEAGERFTQQKPSEAGEQLTQQKPPEAGERLTQQKPPEAGGLAQPDRAAAVKAFAAPWARGITPHALGMTAIRLRLMAEGHAYIPDSKALFQRSVEQQQREFYTEIVRNYVVRETAALAEHYLERELYPFEYQALKEYGDGLGHDVLVVYAQRADARLYQKTVELMFGQLADSVEGERKEDLDGKVGSVYPKIDKKEPDVTEGISVLLSELPDWISRTAVRELFGENGKDSEKKEGDSETDTAKFQEQQSDKQQGYEENLVYHGMKGLYHDMRGVYHDMEGTYHMENRGSKPGEDIDPKSERKTEEVVDSAFSYSDGRKVHMPLSELWEQSSQEERKSLLYRIPQAIRQAASLWKETGQGNDSSRLEEVLKIIVKKIEAVQWGEVSQGMGMPHGVETSQGMGMSQGVETSQDMGMSQGVETSQGMGTFQRVETSPGLGKMQGLEVNQSHGILQGPETVQKIMEQRISEEISYILSKLPDWISKTAAWELNKESMEDYGVRDREMEIGIAKFSEQQSGFSEQQPFMLQGDDDLVYRMEKADTVPMDGSGTKLKEAREIKAGEGKSKENKSKENESKENEFKEGRSKKGKFREDKESKSGSNGNLKPGENAEGTVGRVSLNSDRRRENLRLSELWAQSSQEERKILLNRIPQAVRQAVYLWKENGQGNGGFRQEEILQTIIEKMEAAQSLEAAQKMEVTQRMEAPQDLGKHQSTEANQSLEILRRHATVQKLSEQSVSDKIRHILSELPDWISKMAVRELYKENVEGYGARDGEPETGADKFSEWQSKYPEQQSGYSEQQSKSLEQQSSMLQGYDEDLVYRMEKPESLSMANVLPYSDGERENLQLSGLWEQSSQEGRKVLLRRIPQAVRQAVSLWKETGQGNGGPRQVEILKTIVERMEAVQSLETIQKIENVQKLSGQRIPEGISRILSWLPVWVSKAAVRELYGENAEETVGSILSYSDERRESPLLSELWEQSSQEERKILLHRIPQAVRQATFLWEEAAMERVGKLRAEETAMERVRKLRVEEIAIDRVRKLKAEETAMERVRKLRAEEIAIDRMRNKGTEETAMEKVRNKRAGETISKESKNEELKKQLLLTAAFTWLRPQMRELLPAAEIKRQGIQTFFWTVPEVRMDWSSDPLQYTNPGEGSIVYAAKAADSSGFRQNNEDLQVIQELESRISRQEYMIRQEQIEREELQRRMKKQEGRENTSWKFGNMRFTSKQGGNLSQDVLSQIKEQFRLERIRYGAD